MADIKLTRFTPKQVNLPQPEGQGYTMEVLAEGRGGLESEIFVYQVGKPEDPLPGDKFQKIAALNDLDEIPKEAGVAIDADGGIPFYRTNLLKLTTRTKDESDDLWDKIQDEVQNLVENYEASSRLVGAEVVKITDNSKEILTQEMKPPVRCQLDFKPAGDAGTSNGTQTISNPDDSLTGWLPISEIDPAWHVPNGAALFYNIAKEQELKDLFPPISPLSGHLLYYNGTLLPYGAIWVLTQETIFWLEFDPANFNQMSSNFPWPTDYVDRSNPGSVSPQLTLYLYQE